MLSKDERSRVTKRMGKCKRRLDRLRKLENRTPAEQLRFNAAGVQYATLTTLLKDGDRIISPNHKDGCTGLDWVFSGSGYDRVKLCACGAEDHSPEVTS